MNETAILHKLQNCSRHLNMNETVILHRLTEEVQQVLEQFSEEAIAVAVLHACSQLRPTSTSSQMKLIS